MHPAIRYSGRLPDRFEPNALSRAFTTQRDSGRAPIDLTVSNPDATGLSPAEGEVREILARAAAGPYRPDPAGLRTAREAVASYYAERGARIDPGEVLLTASTSEAYAHLFRLFCDPGDAVLVPRPSYPLFEPLAALEGVELAPYALRYEAPEWRLDLEDVRAGLDTGARGVIVVEPNNPTGSCLTPAVAAEVDALAAAHGVPVLSDEVFGDFVLPGRARRATWAGPGDALTFVLSGLSKVCGLPQLKLGWIVVAGAPGTRAEAVERLEWVTDAFLSVGTPVQHALPELLGLRSAFQARVAARVAANHAALSAALAARGLPPPEPLHGGWTALLRLPHGRDAATADGTTPGGDAPDEEAVALKLLASGVLVQPGYYFDFAEPGWLVLSLLPEPETFARGAELVAAGLA